MNSPRSKWKLYAMFPVAAVFVVIAGGALYVDHFTNRFRACNTAIRNSIASPDGKKAIVIFEKECGATVGFNTQASIAPTDRSFSPDKNPAFFVISGEQVVMAKWLGESEVEIAVIPGGTVFKSENSVGDIKIAYP
jgi:hypothetical protein